MARARTEELHLALARSVGVGDPCHHPPGGDGGRGRPLALILGSEGSGASEAAHSLPGAAQVGVPLSGGLESLGVAQVAPLWHNYRFSELSYID
jgi:hypothetical protein